MASNAHFRKTSALVGGLAPLLLGMAMPALAETAAAPAPAATPDKADKDDQAIIVTGTLFHNRAATIASPVTTLTVDDLAKRGITTVQGALQSLASNNGPALTNSFSANGAFAGGASAVSLRGLSTNSTLVLFNGLRAAYYPLADDGSRNFVDLNTVPDEVVDHVEILRDGASAAYGADAVAGVVNVITKKSYKGFDGTVEAGLAERGIGANQRVSAIAGFGDLPSQGWNFYISGHYIHQQQVNARDLGAPFNTDNQSNICHTSATGTNCGLDNRQNAPGDAFNGVSAIVPVFLVRPFDATNTTAQGRYQFINPTTGCGNYTPYTLTAQQLADNASAPTTVCTQDTDHDGGVIDPKLTRFGGAGRLSVDISNNIRSYVEGSFEQSTSSYTGYGLAGYGNPTNSVIRGRAAAGIFYPPYSTSAFGNTLAAGSGPLTLPVYICPITTVGACNAANGSLNPNNPFAAQGEVARIIGTLPDLQQFTETQSRTYRGAAGVSGTFADDWNFQIDGTVNITDLNRRFDGQIYIQHLLDEIKDGSYNFVNPSANSQAVLSYLSPELNAKAKSGEYQVQGSITHAFFDLPGGPLQVAVGGSWRHESVNSPSANSDVNGPTERYLGINAFGTVGKRDVESGYFEINAPLLRILKLQGSGRYDHYSSGQSHFSPKAGVIFTPIRQVTLRGTVSGGFRIPSFAESSALPTTGYVTYGIGNFPAAFLAQYSNSPTAICTAKTPTNCSTYVTQATIGETSVSNPNLKPEITRNFDLGIDFKPIPGLTITADYYNIRKKGAIQAAPYAAAINAYYNGDPIPAGYTVDVDAPDVNHPGATPKLFAVSAPFVNANTVKTDGIDFSMTYTHTFANNWTFTSSGEAEWIHKLNTTFADGHTEHYAGTIGNYNLTAGTGTPKWKASIANTIDFAKKASITATVYYTAGYNLSAEDQGDTAGDCGLETAIANNIQSCNTRRFIDVDLTGSVLVGDRFTLYMNVGNLFGVKPPLDTVTYGGYLYNPVVGEAAILGRTFRVGAKVHL